MTKTKLIVMAAGIVGSIVAAAFATGVPADAVKAFCENVKPVAVAPAPVDAGSP